MARVRGFSPKEDVQHEHRSSCWPAAALDQGRCGSCQEQCSPS